MMVGQHEGLAAATAASSPSVRPGDPCERAAGGLQQIAGYPDQRTVPMQPDQEPALVRNSTLDLWLYPFRECGDSVEGEAWAGDGVERAGLSNGGRR